MLNPQKNEFPRRLYPPYLKTRSNRLTTVLLKELNLFEYGASYQMSKQEEYNIVYTAALRTKCELLIHRKIMNIVLKRFVEDDNVYLFGHLNLFYFLCLMLFYAFFFLLNKYQIN